MMVVRCSHNDPPQKPVGSEHGIDKAWTWLARLLNLPPRKVTPFVLLAFLEVCLELDSLRGDALTNPQSMLGFTFGNGMAINSSSCCILSRQR